jgi:catechol 2,3-dioxygenase
MTTDVYFRPRRLGHANLWVEELARSQAFYNEVCGLTVEFWEPDLVATFLGTGNTPHDLGMIETTGGKPRYGRNGLLQIPEGVGANVGLGHLAWELENEVELVDAYRRARDANVPMDMTVDHQVAHSVYLYDPDGNSMEYYCDTVKNWRDVLHGEMELITSGWDPDEGQPFSDSRYDDNPEIRRVEDAPIHPRRVTHAVLVTADPERLVEFHTSVGGLEEVGRGEDVVYLRASLSGYPYHLAICTEQSGSSGYHHVSFELESVDAVESAEKALADRGISPELVVDNDTKRSFYLRDPDGLLSEYYVRRSQAIPDSSDAPPRMRAFLA